MSRSGVEGGDHIFSHQPITCPISSCPTTISSMEVFKHFVLEHRGDQHLTNIHDVRADTSSLLLVNFASLVLGKNDCFGLYAFGGKKDDPLPPAESGLCLPSALLPPEWQKYKSHLPILLLACRKSRFALFGNDELGDAPVESNDPKEQMIALWFASPQTAVPIYATITCFDKQHTMSRSQIMKVRQLNKVQDPEEFILNSSNFMLLNYNEIELLGQGGKEFIYMDIKFHIYDDNETDS